MRRISKAASLLIALAMCTSLLGAGALAEEAPDVVTTAAIPSDVDAEQWYYDAVYYVIVSGAMNGTGEDRFEPGGTVTRGMVYQTLYNLEGRPETTAEAFDDVKDTDWFAGAAAWARESGLSQGTGAGFEGYKEMNRAEMATALANYLTYKEVNIATADISDFSDIEAVPAWSEDSFKTAVGAGIIKGKEGGTLDPLGKSLRSELAQVLYNMNILCEAKTDGAVAVVDKYGNITLDIYTQNLLASGLEFGDMLTVVIGENEIEAPFCTDYSDVDVGSVLVRAPGGVGNGKIIIAINKGNFAGTYEAAEGDAAEIVLLEAGAYRDEWELRQLRRTNNRDDYDSDVIFANFREAAAGDIAEGVYFRSSSPVNNDIGRAAYADELTAWAGIKTVINLADSEEALEGYFAAEGFASPYYKSLHEEGAVIALDMGVDFQAEDFKTKLAAGLKFLIDNEGPYLIHCNEGKDRAGFVSALLEALMGATKEEIKADYMLSFVNYYHVEEGSAQYEKIADSNIYNDLRIIAGLEKGASLEDFDLAAAAASYLKGIGMNDDQIDGLKGRLSAEAVTAAA